MDKKVTLTHELAEESPMHLIALSTTKVVQKLIDEGWSFQLEHRIIPGFADWGAIFWTGVGDPPGECWCYGSTPDEAVQLAALLARRGL